VASCGKHFPGHGDTSQDSHLDLPRLPHSLERLRHVELVPFAAWARAGLSSLMTAHVVFEAIDPAVPATMCRAVLTGLLREELGFSGVVVSDDLEMKAIVDHVGVERAAVEGVAAGVDLFLVCHTPEVQRRAIAAVVEAVLVGRLSLGQLELASARIARMTERFAQGPEDRLASLGSDEHQRLASGLHAGVQVGRDPTERGDARQ
jgi:beta-N-acetylhexosaminidase